MRTKERKSHFIQNVASNKFYAIPCAFTKPNKEKCKNEHTTTSKQTLNQGNLNAIAPLRLLLFFFYYVFGHLHLCVCKMLAVLSYTMIDVNDAIVGII